MRKLTNRCFENALNNDGCRLYHIHVVDVVVETSVVETLRKDGQSAKLRPIGRHKDQLDHIGASQTDKIIKLHIDNGIKQLGEVLTVQYCGE